MAIDTLLCQSIGATSTTESFIVDKEIKKLALDGTSRSTPCKCQNLFAKGVHRKFEGHVMPNKDKYQKSVQTKFRY